MFFIKNYKFAALKYFNWYLLVIKFFFIVTSASLHEKEKNFNISSTKKNFIEGSGIFPTKTLKEYTDIQNSGINPDDEPGDDDEDGSGDKVEGSGYIPQNKIKVLTTPIIKSYSIQLNNNNKSSSTTKIPINLILTSKPPVEEKVLTKAIFTEQRIKTTKSLFLLTTSTLKTTIKTSTVRSDIKKLTNIPKTTPQVPPYVFEENHTIEMLKPGILAAISGGAVVGVLLTILLVMFIVYRMRKKDEGSYSLDEPHKPPNYSYAYQKASTKEFYA